MRLEAHSAERYTWWRMLGSGQANAQTKVHTYHIDKLLKLN